MHRFIPEFTIAIHSCLTASLKLTRHFLVSVNQFRREEDRFIANASTPVFV